MKIIDYYIGLPAQTKSSLIIVLILSVVFILLGRRIKKIKPEDKPPGWAIVLELFVTTVNDFTKENLGKSWKKYAPYILTLAIFLIVANLAGLFGFSPPTSSINITGGLAVVTFILIHVTGVRSLGLKNYIKSFFQPFFLFFPLNVVGELTFPLSLALRLFGNILSGVVMVILIYGMFGWFTLPFAPAFHAIFDIFFGLIQALVFVLLTVIFISSKIDDEDKILENL